MKVEFRKAIVGGALPAYGLGEHSFYPGQVAEIHDDLAVKWLNSGVACAVTEERELATVSTPETTTRRRGRNANRRP